MDEKNVRGPMKRLHVTVPTRQYAYLLRVANAKGISLAEVVRRIIDDHIAKEEQ